MFSWSTPARRPDGDATSGGGSFYPGQRVSTTAAAAASTTTTTTQAATAIRGTIRPPDYTREQHLESYLKDVTLQRSTRRVSADDSTYDTVFQTVTNITLILRVHLPPLIHPSAPVRCPAMTLAGVKARHPWLDTRMQVVGFSAMKNDESWRQARLLLGAAVHQVIQHLQVNPPDIIEITDKGLRSIQTTSVGTTNLANHSKQQQQQHSQRTNGTTTSFPSRPPQHDRQASATDAPPDYESLLAAPLPDININIPTHFTELDKMSRDELDLLLEDELSFLAFCNRLEPTQQLQAKALSIVTENAKQAKEHLAQEETLNNLHQEVTQLRTKLQSQLDEFSKLEAQQNQYCAPPDTAQAIRDLNKAKRQAFAESEKIAEDWLDEEDGSNVDDFLNRFIEVRKVHHARAAKMELLQYQQQQPSSNSR